MPQTFEATEAERIKFTNPEELQAERLGREPSALVRAPFWDHNFFGGGVWVNSPPIFWFLFFRFLFFLVWVNSPPMFGILIC